MINTTFKDQIKTLRIVHRLTISEMTHLCHLKNKISIIQFEQGKTHPLYVTWQNIAASFGVSMDWLAGLSAEPYREEVMEKYEEGLQQMESISYIRFETEYENLQQRITSYSLPVRANMVFLLNYLDSIHDSRTYQDKLATFVALQTQKITKPIYKL
jgi:DNA-binding XRE family transcriptional regulator